jgi:hypothetical protein
MTDETEKYAQLLADVVALVDTIDERLGFDDAREKRQDALFAVFDGLDEVGKLNTEMGSSDFGAGHTAGQLFLARRLLMKIKKELE